MSSFSPRGRYASLPEDLQRILNHHPRFRCSYPATRRESLPELRGTRAWIVVPRWGCDSIESVPFSNFSRSSMLIRPSPRPFFAASRVKAHARIPHRKMNLIRRSPQSHFEVPCPTVFYRIVEGLLQDSEEAKRNVWRQGAWQILGFEVNLHLLSAPRTLGRSLSWPQLCPDIPVLSSATRATRFEYRLLSRELCFCNSPIRLRTSGKSGGSWWSCSNSTANSARRWPMSS